MPDSEGHSGQTQPLSASPLGERPVLTEGVIDQASPSNKAGITHYSYIYTLTHKHIAKTLKLSCSRSDTKLGGDSFHVALYGFTEKISKVHKEMRQSKLEPEKDSIITFFFSIHR